MTRLLHTADWHVGLHTHGAADPFRGVSARTLELEESLSWLVCVAEEQKVDGIVVAGDVAHTRSLNSYEVGIIGDTLRSLSRVAPTCVLVGNHDRESVISRKSYVEYLGSIAGVTVVDSSTLVRFGDTPLLAISYPNRAFIEAQGWTLGDAARRLEEMVVLEAQEHESMLVAGHFTVSGLRFNAAAQPIIGTTMDFTVNPQAFDVYNIQAVLMGHLHGVQTFGKVHYCGSLMPLTFGEESDEPKGATIYDTETGFAIAHANPYAPIFHTFTHVRGQEFDAGAIGTPRRAYVRLKANYRLTSDERAGFEAFVRGNGWTLCGMLEDVPRELRPEARSVAEGKSPSRIVEEYCKAHGIENVADILALMDGADASSAM